MIELKVGMVLWAMYAREQNDMCKWYVKPRCIEFVDDKKVLFSDGSGGSISNLGNGWFLTRQEALDNFFKKHDSLEVPFPEISKTEEENVTHLPRTDFQNVEVVESDTVNTTTVYSGYLTNLVKINELLEWHSEYVEGLYMDVKSLALSEIWEQTRTPFLGEIITVFVDSPLHGIIYQCGNHEEGKWEKIGETQGYA